MFVKSESSSTCTLQAQSKQQAAVTGGNVVDSDDSSDVGVSSDEDRIIYFAGEVSELACSQAIAALFMYAKSNPKKPVYLVIETYGGCVDSMNALYDAIKFVPCPVHTIGLGKIMSAGVLILAAGEKGHRQIGPSARVMTHAAHGEFDGNIFEFKNEYKEFKRLEEQRLERIARETGTDIETWNQLNESHGDRYLAPAECIELGIVDSLLYDDSLGEQDPASHCDAKSTSLKKKSTVKKTTRRSK